MEEIRGQEQLLRSQQEALQEQAEGRQVSAADVPTISEVSSPPTTEEVSSPPTTEEVSSRPTATAPPRYSFTIGGRRFHVYDNGLSETMPSTSSSSSYGGFPYSSAPERSSRSVSSSHPSISDVEEAELGTIDARPSADAPAELPAEEAEVQGDDETSRLCSICLEPMDDGRPIAAANPTCTHEFHAECIERWQTRSTTCPLCRQQWPPSASTIVAESLGGEGGREGASPQTRGWQGLRQRV